MQRQLQHAERVAFEAGCHDDFAIARRAATFVATKTAVGVIRQVDQRLVDVQFRVKTVFSQTSDQCTAGEGVQVRQDLHEPAFSGSGTAQVPALEALELFDLGRRCAGQPRWGTFHLKRNFTQHVHIGQRLAQSMVGRKRQMLVQLDHPQQAADHRILHLAEKPRHATDAFAQPCVVHHQVFQRETRGADVDRLVTHSQRVAHRMGAQVVELIPFDTTP